MNTKLKIIIAVLAWTLIPDTIVGVAFGWQMALSGLFIVGLIFGVLFLSILVLVTILWINGEYD